MTSTDIQGYAIKLTETFTDGCYEDDSIIHRRVSKILVYSDEDKVNEAIASFYGDQDYSYKVSIQTIGYIDCIVCYDDHHGSDE